MRSKEYNNKSNNISISGKKISNNNNTKLKAERKKPTGVAPKAERSVEEKDRHSMPG